MMLTYQQWRLTEAGSLWLDIAPAFMHQRYKDYCEAWRRARRRFIKSSTYGK